MEYKFNVLFFCSYDLKSKFNSNRKFKICYSAKINTPLTTIVINIAVSFKLLNM